MQSASPPSPGPTPRDDDVKLEPDLADGSGAREFRTPFRYVWPSELDLMAKLAGLSPRDRWAGWDRSPFTGESAAHVSVWTKD